MAFQAHASKSASLKRLTEASGSSMPGAIEIGHYVGRDQYDMRYYSAVSVYLDQKTGDVEIVPISSAAAGGMDSDTGGMETGGNRVKLNSPKAADLTFSLKRVMMRDPYLKGGKPTKNFEWKLPDGEKRGFSAILVKAVLAAWAAVPQNESRQIVMMDSTGLLG